MRKLFDLNTVEDCLSLSRSEAIAVLRAMTVIGWQGCVVFQHLWTFPPGVNKSKWVGLYSPVPQINTGKGNSSKKQLAHRVAHYLGFTIPTSAAAASPPVQNVVFPPPFAEMTMEQKRAMLAQLQAEIDKSEAKAPQAAPAEAGSDKAGSDKSGGQQGK